MTRSPAQLLDVARPAFCNHAFLSSSHPHLASWFSVPVVCGWAEIEKLKEKGATVAAHRGSVYLTSLLVPNTWGTTPQ